MQTNEQRWVLMQWYQQRGLGGSIPSALPKKSTNRLDHFVGEEIHWVIFESTKDLESNAASQNWRPLLEKMRLALSHEAKALHQIVESDSLNKLEGLFEEVQPNSRFLLLGDLKAQKELYPKVISLAEMKNIQTYWSHHPKILLKQPELKKETWTVMKEFTRGLEGSRSSLKH